MKQNIGKALLILLIAIIGFHLLVLLGIVSYKIVWGGRIHSVNEMLKFETISIGINALMTTVVSIYIGYIKSKVDKKATRLVLWLMFVLFLLNTMGNLFSENAFEKIIFTPLTALMALLSFLLLKKDPELSIDKISRQNNDR